MIEINEASQSQTVEAIQAAHHAFQYTDWPSNPSMRIAALRQLADLLENSSTCRRLHHADVSFIGSCLFWVDEMDKTNIGKHEYDGA